MNLHNFTTDNNTQELLVKGEELFSRGDFPGAIESFKQAIESSPGSAEAYNNLGVVLLQTGDKVSAIANFRRAVEIDPIFKDAVLNLGEILESDNQTTEARKIYTFCLENGGDYPEIKKVLKSLQNNSPAPSHPHQADKSSPGTNKAASFKVKKHEQGPPSISIVIPVLENNAALGSLLDSLAKQKYHILECIIVHTLHSPVKLYASNDSISFKTVASDAAHITAMFNQGIAESTGEVVGIVTPEGRYFPEAIETVADYFHRHPGRGIAVVNCSITGESGETIAVRTARQWDFSRFLEFWKFGSFPLLSTLFFRKQLFADAGGFDENLREAWLYDLLLKITRNRTIFSIDKELAELPFNYVRQFDESISFENDSEWKRTYLQHKSAANPDPIVSVIIPCYNYGKYLPESVGSILKQTFSDYEIIIVNDGSPDDTSAVAQKIIRENPLAKIKLIEQENSGQPAISRNRGIASAAGEYIMALDGDDMIHPAYLQEAVDTLDSQPGIAMVYPDQTHVWPDKTKIFQSSEWEISKFRQVNLLPHCAVFRRHLWEEIGGFQTNIIGYEDWDFWIGIAEKGYIGKRIPRPYFIYRRHEGSVFATTEERDQRLRAQAALNHPRLFGNKMVQDARDFFQTQTSTQEEPVKIINKTMDYADLLKPEAQPVIDALNQLITEMKKHGVNISSWYGHFDLQNYPDRSEQINRGYNYQPLPGAVDDVNFPWFLYWELIWVILNADFQPGQKVLDLGGSSSLFSFYLAALGLEVTTVDLQEDLVRNAELVARATGWKLKNHTMDMRHLNFSEKFDHIVSICVYEHIPMYDRVEINSRIKALLKPGGRFSITFDYRNPSKFTRFNTSQDVFDQFIKPSGLHIRENSEFFDNGKNYLLHPFYYKEDFGKFRDNQVKKGHFDRSELGKVKNENDYTFAALFLEN